MGGGGVVIDVVIVLWARCILPIWGLSLRIWHTRNPPPGTVCTVHWTLLQILGLCFKWPINFCYLCLNPLQKIAVTKKVGYCVVPKSKKQSGLSVPSTTQRFFLSLLLKGLYHQIRIAWQWYCFKRLGMDMRRLILKKYEVSLQFLIGIWSSYA